MKVFISWSGARSHRVATLLHVWLKRVIQALEPWESSSDIESGAVWFSKITRELNATNQSIICLTRENKEKPWILFESGALAKELDKARVYTLLIDLDSVDIQDPLAQFNHTKPTREGMYKLISTINGHLESKPLEQNMLDGVFETYWPGFESEFAKILAETEATAPVEVSRAPADILSEILETVRKTDRRVSILENDIQRIKRQILRSANSLDLPRYKLSPLGDFVKGMIQAEASSDEIVNAVAENFPGEGLEKLPEIMREVRNFIAHS